MATLGNIIWFVLFGWWHFLAYSFLGCVCCITVIGIPLGKSVFQCAKLMALPFGKVIVRETDIKGKENVSDVRQVGGVIANILWLPIGVILFILSVFEMIALAITIIGIPAAVVVARCATFWIWPIGAKVITKEQEETLRMEKAMMKVAGNAMAINQSMAGSSQGLPPTWRISDAQEDGSQALESLKQTGSRAAAAIAEMGNAGLAALKRKQGETAEEKRLLQVESSVSELLEQMEAKLYQDKVMAWVMPFLEYVTLGICILLGAIVLLFSGYVYPSYVICMISPLLCAAGVLGIIKRSHWFALLLAGIQLVADMLVTIRFNGSPGAFAGGLLVAIFWIGIMAWYVYALMLDKKSKEDAVFPFSSNFSMEEENGAEGEILPDRRFCSQCGAEYTGKVSFCPQCGEPADCVIEDGDAGGE